MNKRILLFKAAVTCFLLPGTLLAATFTVSSTADSGAGTLRQAILDINGAGNSNDTIEFSVPFGSTITLASALPDLTAASNITITGGVSAAYCTIDGAGSYSILRLTNLNTSLSVSGLSFRNGRAVPVTGQLYRGGAIYHSATSTSFSTSVTNCHFEGNAAIYVTGASPDADGGAIYTGTNLTLDNCTFTQNFTSSASGNTATPQGGAVHCTRTVTATDCIFTGNYATTTSIGSAGAPQGGAMYASTSAILNNCEFTNNYSELGPTTTSGSPVGGALYTATVTIDGCTFTGNYAQSLSTISNGPTGGAIRLAASNAYTISNSRFEGNFVRANGTGLSSCTGGAIHGAISGTSTLISDTEFIANFASSPNTTNVGSLISTAALFVTHSANATITVDGCTFRDNYAYANAGEARGGALRGLVGTGGILTVRLNNSEFSDNEATSVDGIANGGAVALFGTISAGASANLEINNSTFYNNQATSTSGSALGGAIYTASTTNNTINTIIRNSTLVGNVASAPTSSGGAILPRVSFPANVTLSNSLIANNGATDYPNLAPATSYTSDGYNLISDLGALNFSANNNDIYGDTANTTTPNPGSTDIAAALDPQYLPLANNGGPTRTCALLYTSIAFNAGDPTYSGPLLTDQRGTGYPRVRGGSIEIGAWEAPTRAVSLTRVNPAVTNLTSLDYTLTFESPVTDLDASNFTVAGFSGASVTGITGGPTVYTVTMNPGVGEGVVGLTLANNTDLLGDGVSPVNGIPLVGETYTVDTIVPTLAALIPSETGPVTPAATVNFPANFSQSVTGFTSADVTIDHSGTGAGSVSITGGPQNYTIEVTGVTGVGSYTITVGTGVEDSGGNALSAAVTSGSVAVDDGTSVADWKELQE